MKQHITPKQLKELSEKGRRNLAHWVKGQDEIEIRYNQKDFSLNGGPLLSIGQMIEFLIYHAHDPQAIHITDRYCDALWEAVKEVLEEENDGKKVSS